MMIWSENKQNIDFRVEYTCVFDVFILVTTWKIQTLFQEHMIFKYFVDKLIRDF